MKTATEPNVRLAWFRKQLSDFRDFHDEVARLSGQSETEFEQGARSTLDALLAVPDERLADEVRENNLYYQRHDWTSQHGQGSAAMYAAAYDMLRHYGLEGDR